MPRGGGVSWASVSLRPLGPEAGLLGCTAGELVEVGPERGLLFLTSRPEAGLLAFLTIRSVLTSIVVLLGTALLPRSLVLYAAFLVFWPVCSRTDEARGRDTLRMLGPFWLTELVLLLAILWAAVDLVKDGFGSLARGLLTANPLVKRTEELPTRLAVCVLAFPGANPTLPGATLPTFLTRGLTPRIRLPGRSGRGQRGFVGETFGGDMVELTENQICPNPMGPEGGQGVRGQCEKGQPRLQRLRQS